MRADDDQVLVLRSTASEAVTRGKTRVRGGTGPRQGVAALAEAAADPVALSTTGGEYHG